MSAQPPQLIRNKYNDPVFSGPNTVIEGLTFGGLWWKEGYNFGSQAAQSKAVAEDEESKTQNWDQPQWNGEISWRDQY